MEPENDLAAFLARPVEFGAFCFNVLYLYFFIAVNLSVIAIVVNAIVYATTDSPSMKVVWAHYVIGALFALFVIMRCSFIRRERRLVSIRRITYLVILVCVITQISVGSANYAMTQYVIPSLIMGLSLFTFFALAIKWATLVSLFYTLMINALMSIVPFILSFTTKGAFTDAGAIIVYISFGVAVLAFVNAVFLRVLSTIFQVREGTEII